jgi:hypothetical protein
MLHLAKILFHHSRFPISFPRHRLFQNPLPLVFVFCFITYFSGELILILIQLVFVIKVIQKQYYRIDMQQRSHFLTSTFANFHL